MGPAGTIDAGQGLRAWPCLATRLFFCFFSILIDYQEFARLKETTSIKDGTPPRRASDGMAWNLYLISTQRPLLHLCC